jgi:hypothetical protein
VGDPLRTRHDQAPGHNHATVANDERRRTALTANEAVSVIDNTEETRLFFLVGRPRLL